MSRKTAREQAFKILFAIDVGENTIEEAMEIAIPSLNDQGQKKFVLDEVNGVLNNLESIDEIINKYSGDWKVNRMASSDRNILRIAIYEILYRDDIPASVSINEAVEIAKKYSDEKSYKFINGLLGSVVREYESK
ncbi:MULTISPECIES: transcription antitermination factor NusB [Tepidanaerobacter]|uniref:Transcription antitermination protein NusB n=1 Tax=Tepidanaerobacter syntrophicus TaxID=224999 RepID=A0A0U9HHD2_9FIRM|nr:MULTISPECIES: transcription antitermination factor NusB [Tepidanaerobacter]GAQ26125.1 N utilization substance protein B [Tepidanaerobacter syntrophicus]GLI19112.1 N utilization substance protein B [Tepidanaerobacter syntrophicus]GLI50257.1 N utilization substance protein B [Tepidanaerobacter syntrophicus]HHV82116.1 transcription antitermination factor NusB [Tepidanaerobacter syntrophicus]